MAGGFGFWDGFTQRQPTYLPKYQIVIVGAKDGRLETCCWAWHERHAHGHMPLSPKAASLSLCFWGRGGGGGGEESGRKEEFRERGTGREGGMAMQLEGQGRTGGSSVLYSLYFYYVLCICVIYLHPSLIPKAP